MRPSAIPLAELLRRASSQSETPRSTLPPYFWPMVLGVTGVALGVVGLVLDVAKVCR